MGSTFELSVNNFRESLQSALDAARKDLASALSNGSAATVCLVPRLALLG
jgi:predicted DNA-binding protein (UPF0251 family)